METLEQKVEGLTGLAITTSSNPTQSELLTFLTNGVNDVINRLQMINPAAVVSISKETTIANDSTVDIEGEIISVYGTESNYKRPAVEIDPNLRFLAEDPSSIYYQSKFNPAYYRKGQSVGIIPDGGTVLHTIKPNVVSINSVDIEHFPQKYLHLVCLYASVQALRNAMAAIESNLTSYASPGDLSIPNFEASLPANLVVPNFPYITTELKSATSGTSITRTNIDSSIPMYIGQSLSLPSLSAIGDISMPTAPAAPVVADVTLDFNPDTDKPIYNKPSLVIPEFPSFNDFSLTGTAASPPSQVVAPAFTAETVSDHSIGTLPGPPIYAPPKVLGVVEELLNNAPAANLTATAIGAADNLEAVLDNAWYYIQEEEDPEQATAALGYAQQVVSMFSTEMTNKMNEYNSKVQEYTQEVQKVMQQAQMDRGKKDKQTDMNWQKQLNQYQQDLAKHQADVALYQAEINKQVQEWQMQNITYKMAKWNSEVSNALQEHSANMTNELNKFNEQDKLYQMKWQKAMQDSTLSTQNIGNVFQEFDKAMSKYTQEVNTEVQRYQQDELLKKWELYKQDTQKAFTEHTQQMTNSMNTFNSDNAKFQMEIQVAQANANNVQASLMSQMQLDTELAKHNSMQLLQADLNKFQQDITNYQAQIGKYSAEISTQQSEYSQIMAKYGQDLANAMNTFNTSLQKSDKEYAWMQGRMQQLSVEYNQSMGLMAQQQQGEA